MGTSCLAFSESLSWRKRLSEILSVRESLRDPGFYNNYNVLLQYSSCLVQGELERRTAPKHTGLLQEGGHYYPSITGGARPKHSFLTSLFFPPLSNKPLKYL